MTLYRKRREHADTEEAIQWTGNNYKDFTEFCRPTGVAYSTMSAAEVAAGWPSQRAMILDRDFPMWVDVGDFIVRSDAGELDIWDPENFGATYDPVEPAAAPETPAVLIWNPSLKEILEYVADHAPISFRNVDREPSEAADRRIEQAENDGLIEYHHESFPLGECYYRLTGPGRREMDRLREHALRHSLTEIQKANLLVIANREMQLGSFIPAGDGEAVFIPELKALGLVHYWSENGGWGLTSLGQRTVEALTELGC